MGRLADSESDSDQWTEENKYNSLIIESEQDGQPVMATIAGAFPWFMGRPKKTQDLLGLIWWEVKDRGHELKGKLNELISTVYQTIHSERTKPVVPENRLLLHLQVYAEKQLYLLCYEPESTVGDLELHVSFGDTMAANVCSLRSSLDPSAPGCRIFVMCCLFLSP